MFDNTRNKVMDLGAVYCDFISIRDENMFLAEYKYDNHPVVIRFTTISDIGRSADGDAFVSTTFKCRNGKEDKDEEITVRCLLKDPYSKYITELRVGFLATINGYFSAKQSATKENPNYIVLTKCTVDTGVRYDTDIKQTNIECPCCTCRFNGCMGCIRCGDSGLPDFYKLRNIEDKLDDLTEAGIGILNILTRINKSKVGCGELLCAVDALKGAYNTINNLRQEYVKQKFDELRCLPCKYYREK